MGFFWGAGPPFIAHWVLLGTLGALLEHLGVFSGLSLGSVHRVLGVSETTLQVDSPLLA